MFLHIDLLFIYMFTQIVKPVSTICLCACVCVALSIRCRSIRSQLSARMFYARTNARSICFRDCNCDMAIV